MSDLKKMSIDLKKLLKEDGYNVPLTKVQEMLSKIHGFKNRHVALSKGSDFDITNDYKEAIKNVSDIEKESILLGIPELDRHLNEAGVERGLKRGTISFLLGNINSGVSASLVSIGSNASKRGIRVLHVGMEASTSLIKLKYMSNLFETRYTGLVRKYESCTSLEKKEMLEKISTTNISVFNPNGVDEVSELINNICIKYQETPFDLLIIDGYNNISTNNHYSSAEAMKDAIDNRLKRMAEGLDVSILASYKVRQLPNENNQIECTDTEEYVFGLGLYGYPSLSHAENVISISRTHRELIESKCRFTISYMRNGGRIGRQIGINSNFERFDTINGMRFFYNGH